MARQQVTGNVGMYYAAYRLLQTGWNVMPTSRNARGIDLLAYDSTAGRYLGIQIKTTAPSRGIKGLDNLLGESSSCCCSKSKRLLRRPWEIGDIVDVPEAWEGAN
jgi:hypothetical protein